MGCLCRPYGAHVRLSHATFRWVGLEAQADGLGTYRQRWVVHPLIERRSGLERALLSVALVVDAVPSIEFPAHPLSPADPEPRRPSLRIGPGRPGGRLTLERCQPNAGTGTQQRAVVEVKPRPRDGGRAFQCPAPGLGAQVRRSALAAALDVAREACAAFKRSPC